MIYMFCLYHFSLSKMYNKKNYLFSYGPLKKNWVGDSEGGIFILPYAADLMLIMYPLWLRGYMISMG